MNARIVAIRREETNRRARSILTSRCYATRHRLLRFFNPCLQK